MISERLGAGTSLVPGWGMQLGLLARQLFLLKELATAGALLLGILEAADPDRLQQLPQFSAGITLLPELSAVCIASPRSLFIRSTRKPP